MFHLPLERLILLVMEITHLFRSILLSVMVVAVHLILLILVVEMLEDFQLMVDL
jgi:hypothetical protein